MPSWTHLVGVPAVLALQPSLILVAGGDNMIGACGINKDGGYWLEPVPLLHSWARAQSSCITVPRSWVRVLEAAFVLYAMCKLYPGVLDVAAMFVGAFEYFVGTGAANPGVAIRRMTVGLAVSPSAALEAFRWRYGFASTVAWRAPRLHYTRGSRMDAVRSLIAPLWNHGQLQLRGQLYGGLTHIVDSLYLLVGVPVCLLQTEAMPLAREPRGGRLVPGAAACMWVWIRTWPP